MCAAPAASAAAPRATFDGMVVRHAVTLDGNTVGSFSVGCPRRFVATGGSTTSGGAGVVQRVSAPGTNQRRWRFSYASSGTVEQRIVVAVVCARLRIPSRTTSLRFSLRTLRSRLQAVAPRTVRRSTSVCRRGYVPLGAGAVTANLNTEDVVADALTPERLAFGRRGVTLDSANRTARTLRGGVAVRCFRTRVEVTGDEDLRVVARQKKITRSAAPGGDDVFETRCPRGTFPASTGYSLPAGAGLTLLAAPIGRDGTARWRVRNPGTITRPVELTAMCLPGRMGRSRST